MLLWTRISATLPGQTPGLGFTLDLHVDVSFAEKSDLSLDRDLLHLESMTSPPTVAEIYELNETVCCTVDGLNDRKDAERAPLASELVIKNLN